MQWTPLTSIEQLQSADKTLACFVIFKHSTRCSISEMAKNRIERKAPNPLPVVCFYLDLLNYRDISAFIANHYNVIHESPQFLIIQNGKCTYHASHQEVQWEDPINLLV